VLEAGGCCVTGMIFLVPAKRELNNVNKTNRGLMQIPVNARIGHPVRFTYPSPCPRFFGLFRK